MPAARRKLLNLKKLKDENPAKLTAQRTELEKLFSG